WSWNRESLPQRDREIIGLPARAWQRKVPPLLRIVYKSSPRHHQNQLLPPAALGSGDGFRRRVRPDVGTIITGTHVDAAVRRAKVHVGGAVAIVLGGIEGGRIVGFQIDQREIEGCAGGVTRTGGNVTQAKQVGLAERRIVALLCRCCPAVSRAGHHSGNRPRRA